MKTLETHVLSLYIIYFLAVVCVFLNFIIILVLKYYIDTGRDLVESEAQQANLPPHPISHIPACLSILAPKSLTRSFRNTEELSGGDGPGTTCCSSYRRLYSESGDFNRWFFGFLLV